MKNRRMDAVVLLPTLGKILCSPNGFVFANSKVGVRNYLPSGSIGFEDLEILLDRGLCWK